MISNDYLWNIAVAYECQPKWRSLFNSVNYYGVESNQVDAFDIQNISSIFYAFEAFF